MTTKTRSRRKSTTTPEQRAEQMAEIHATLAAEVEALRSSTGWATYLTAAVSFHRYSLNNLLLILAQRPDATQVAGYGAWQKMGRQVRKGEKGIRIIAPASVKTGEVDEATGEEKRRTVFHVTRVFDVSQTDPIEGTEDKSATAEQVDEIDPAELLAAVADHLTGTGWTVTTEDLSHRPGLSGFATTSGGNRVVIGAHLAPADAATTALHEAAHVTLGHVDQDNAEYAEHRGRCEVEAESVAYIVGTLVGLHSTAAENVRYVASWAEQASPEVIRETAARVLAAAHQMAEAITATEDQADQAA